MSGYYKNIYSISVVILIFVTMFVTSKPIPDRSKIRIHIPVKHHTHYHTKTVVKHVPVKHHEIEEVVHKPYKYHHRLGDDDEIEEVVHKPYKYHHRLAADDDDDDDDFMWPHTPHKPYIKKKKFQHPFIKK